MHDAKRTNPFNISSWLGAGLSCGRLGSIPSRTNTQVLNKIEEKELPLLYKCKWLDFRVFSEKDVKP